MKKIYLDQKDRHALVVSIRRIVGQLHAISTEIENDKISEQTFTQLLAVKGGASKICKEIISKGVLNSIGNYSKDELDQALNIIFKLDN